ncbi:MAG: stage III sporulation protein AE [Clostridiales bacterium]|nr:stage III sporulation protein AE [Clostridiales bacterium]
MKIRKKTAAVFTLTFIILVHPVETYAYSGENIWQENDFDLAQDTFKSMFPEYSFDGKQVLSLIAQGKIISALSMLASGLLDMVKAQFGEIKMIFVMILLLGITAALFSNFADVLQSHQVSDIAFYFIYLMLITVLIKVFGNAAAIVKEMLNQLITFIQLFIPAYILTIGTASGAASAASYYQLFLMAVYIINKLYLLLIMPMVYCFVLLSVINGVWMEEKLNLLLDLIHKVIGGCIKITLGIVTGLGMMQSMISPIIDALETSALKKAVSAIPGIGNLTEGVFEMVAGSAVLIKNSIGIYITLVMLFICAIPIIKLLLLSGVLKAGSALVGIVSDKRLTNCANRVGDGSLMLLKISLSSIALFIISIAIMACATNRGM